MFILAVSARVSDNFIFIAIEGEESVTGNVVFVKNLNFTTTEEKLKEVRTLPLILLRFTQDPMITLVNEGALVHSKLPFELQKPCKHIALDNP